MRTCIICREDHVQSFDHTPSKALSHTKNIYRDEDKPHAEQEIQNMNPLAQPYTPHRHTSAGEPKTPMLTDFVKYLAHQDLVTTGLNQFDD